MTELLAASRAAFLTEVSRSVSPRYRDVAFQEILDALTEWSVEPHRELEVRPPGEQHTVSFGVRQTGDVLWAAYPRGDDGAKVVVLPRRFRRLPQKAQTSLIGQHSVVAPSIRVEGTNTLQCPMHLLAPDRALSAYLDLLAEAQGASLDSAAG